MNGPVVATKLRIPRTPSMPVERLDSRLDAVWRHRVALVVAPAGSGKTTLLTRLAARAPGPVGWYRAEGWDGDEESLLRHIEAALLASVSGLQRGWKTVEDAANAFGSWTGSPLLVIVDDVHTLQDTPAERALERLIDYAPESVCFAFAARVPPRFNLSRLRLSGALLELTGDDLRLRSWEVEQLFRDFYAEPLPPEELARLARRTEGWAAGLQMFHLATRGRTADERRRVLSELDGSARLMREYLARNVLHQLPDNLRRFLLDTSVLGRLTGPLCDHLLGQHGSADLLAELEERRLFTQPLPEEGAYRYHEVLRSYLHAVLLDELGEEGMRGRFRAAGNLLAEAGAVPEALEAYCRGEDWERARQILEGRGDVVAERSSAWLESVPGAVVRHDPWLLLASARRLRAEGRIREAVDNYQRAETAFGSADPALICRNERLALMPWLGESTDRRLDAFALVRSALRRDPMSVGRAAENLEQPSNWLVAGLTALLAGNVASARRDLLHVAERVDASRAVVVVASLGAGVCGAMMGQPHALLEIEGAVAAAESAGLEWLARLGRAALALSGTPEHIREAENVAQASGRLGDEWGEVLASLCAAWGGINVQRDVVEADRWLSQLRALDAPVLEAWMRSIVALAGVRGGEPESRADAVAAEALARTVGVDAARLLAYLALADAAADPSEAAEFRNLARSIARETGLRPPTEASDDAEGRSGAPAAGFPPTVIRLLGGFELRLGGESVDLSAVRPRARALLRLLCLNAGRGVHHESIENALWPDADAVSSARNLHVAIAALRRAIEPAAMRGSFQVLRREGDAYLLAVPQGSEIDVVQFETSVAAADRARLRGDLQEAQHLYEYALGLYRGELLPEDGPAEWVAERREACRLAAVEALQALAEIQLDGGDAARAARTCTAGLQIERYHDPLWRLLISARDQAGDQGAAMAARQGYDRMLAELGVSSATGSAPQ